MSLEIFILALAVQAVAGQQSYCVVQGEKLVPTAKTTAIDADWYAEGKTMVLGKKSYVKYGFPQIMGPDDLEYWMSKDAVPVMVKAGGTYRDVVYVQSSNSLCEFQPYRVVEAAPKKKR